MVFLQLVSPLTSCPTLPSVDRSPKSPQLYPLLTQTIFIQHGCVTKNLVVAASVLAPVLAAPITTDESVDLGARGPPSLPLIPKLATSVVNHPTQGHVQAQAQAQA